MIKKDSRFQFISLLVICLVFIGFAVYEVGKVNNLKKELNTLSTEVTAFRAEAASTTALLRAELTNTDTKLTTKLTEQNQNVGAITQKLQQQVGSVTGTLTNLQKLAKTDPQLLSKYSKVFFLNENYAPDRLTGIPDAYKYSNTKAVSIQSDVWPHLKDLIDDAKKAGVTLFIQSGYRSFAEQKNLKSDYKVIYGSGTANSFSADQGYSEHQLGTAVDFITPGLGGELDGFEKTTAYPWLLANAYKYGFVISYPEGNTHYVFEPWHWRFVGVQLATDLRKDGKNFYDADQRAIDTYLISIFD